MPEQIIKEEIALIEKERARLKVLITNLKNRQKTECATINKKYLKKIYTLMAELNKLDFYLCEKVMKKEGDRYSKCSN